jgi:hypothetical protein
LEKFPQLAEILPLDLLGIEVASPGLSKEKNICEGI